MTLLKIFNADSRSTWLDNVCFGNLLMVQFPINFFCRTDTGILELAKNRPNKYDYSPKLSAKNIEVLTGVGVGVGGGSLINNGITYRPFIEGWNYAFDADELPYMTDIWQDLESAYFSKAESMFNATPIPEDIFNSQYYVSSQIHHQTLIDAGYPETNGTDDNRLHGTDLLPMIVDWDKVRAEMRGELTPSIIDGEVWLGSNSGAKNSLDKEHSYLGLAKATGSVSVRELHTVSAINFDEETSLYLLTVVKTDKKYRVLEYITVTTPNLIVSAGSVGTTKLMVAAKNKNGLPNLNEHVGTRWSNNGNTATLRVVSTEHITQGGPAGSKSTNFDDPNAPLVIENLSMKVSNLVELQSENADLLGAITTIAVGVPEKFGHFSWDDETYTVNLHWPADGSKNIYDRFYSLMTELDPYGEHRQFPIETAQKMTLHPLGGMPIGLALDEHCRVKGYNHLYAIDGSIIPGASAIANPTLLITAMAERCIAQVVDDIVANQ